MSLAAIPTPDLAALALFVVLWLGYGPAQRHLGAGAINAGLPEVRVLWMRSMLLRDNRIADASLLGHVLHSASFFASTSLIAIGALIGALSGLDRLRPALEGLAPAAAVPTPLLELKVLLPLAVLVHGLFKLTWSLRQLNYSVALIGAMPPGTPAEPLLGELAARLGAILTRAVSTFNEGIRSYYFALAGLLWLVSPWALMAGSLGLIALLVHRQVGSEVAAEFAAAVRLVRAVHPSSPPPAPGDKTAQP